MVSRDSRGLKRLKGDNFKAFKEGNIPRLRETNARAEDGSPASAAAAAYAAAAVADVDEDGLSHPDAAAAGATVCGGPCAAAAAASSYAECRQQRTAAAADVTEVGP